MTPEEKDKIPVDFLDSLRLSESDKREIEGLKQSRLMRINIFQEILRESAMPAKSIEDGAMRFASIRTLLNMLR